MVTKYILTTTKTTAQNTAANRAKLTVMTTLVNGSDNLLLTLLDAAMGCQPFTGRDLADTGVNSFIPSLALNELAASKLQAQPQAIVPDNDPMVRVNTVPNVVKLGLYRVGVNQPVGVSSATLDYCKNYAAIAAPRFLANKALFLKTQTVDPATGDSMFTFLAARFSTSFGANGLNCVGLGLVSPVTVTLNGAKVAVDANINLAVIQNTGNNVNNNNNNLNTALIGEAVGGGVGGLLVLGGTFFLVRRRSRRSLDRATMKKMESSNPGFNGAGSTSSFKGWRQTFQPAQWGQNIRQSVMKFGGGFGGGGLGGGFGGGGLGGGSGGVGGGGGNMNFGGNGGMSPMSSMPPPRFQPNQYGGAPSPYGGSPYGGAPSAYGGAQYGNQPGPSFTQPFGGGGGGGGGGYRGYQ